MSAIPLNAIPLDAIRSNAGQIDAESRSVVADPERVVPEGAGPEAAAAEVPSGDRYAVPTEVRPGVSDSPWAPLSVPVFRAFWLASLVSNLGTWVHEVGAGWLMTSLDASPQMVAAVRVALTLPTLLLAIPAGVLADRLDRRQLLIVTQLCLLATTATLASLTFAQVITPWGLLTLTFVMGLGMVLHVLNWQSTIPLLVPRRQLSRAIALGSISFNLARAAGPALGGILIAMAGPWIAFAINSLSFAGVLAVLIWWKPEATSSSTSLSFRESLSEGFRFMAGQRTMRHVLISVFLFLVPATAVWSLLPLVATQQLGWQVEGFGLLVTTLGLGAVLAARGIHSLHRRFQFDRTVGLAMLVFALGLLTLSQSRQPGVVLLASLVMGAAWMLAMTTLNASAQMTLPNPLRARGMGSYMTIVAASMSCGSLLWGQVAGQIGLVATQCTAAVTLLVTAAIRFRFSIDEASDAHHVRSDQANM